MNVTLNTPLPSVFGSPIQFRQHPFGTTLPPGVRDADCDGPAPLQADWPEHALWQKCRPHQQEKLSEQFARSNLELLRDAILDADSTAPPIRAARGFETASSLLSAIWPAWIRFRNRMLREMRRTGQIPGP